MGLKRRAGPPMEAEFRESLEANSEEEEEEEDRRPEVHPADRCKAGSDGCLPLAKQDQVHCHGTQRNLAVDRRYDNPCIRAVERSRR